MALNAAQCAELEAKNGLDSRKREVHRSILRKNRAIPSLESRSAALTQIRRWAFILLVRSTVLRMN